MPLTTPLALLGLLFVPAVVAMYLLKLRREETGRPVDPAVAAARRRRRGQRAVAAAPAEPPVPAPAAPRRSSSSCWPRGRSSSGRPASPGTSSSSSTRRPAWARPTCPRTASRRRRTRRSTPCATCRPAARSASSRPVGRPGSSPRARPTSGRIRLAIESIQPTTAAGDLARRPRARLGARVAVRRRRGARSRPTPPWRPSRRRPSTPRSGSSGSATSVAARNQAIVALAVRTAPSAVTRSVFVSIANLDVEPAMRRLEVWGDGRLLEARDVRMGAQQRADVIIDDVDLGVGVVEVRLVARRRFGRPGDAAGPARRRRSRLGHRAARSDRARSSSSARAIRTSRRRCPTSPTRACSASSRTATRPTPSAATARTGT